MSSLHNFPYNPNETTTFAKNERLISNLPDVQLNSSATFIQKYPEININRELFHASRSRDDKSVLIAVDESVIKVICRTFFDEGLTSALQEAGKAPNWIGSSARYVLQLLDAGRRLKVFFRPHLKIQGVDCIATFSQTRDWMKSPIRCIAWNPDCFKLAVAAVDDSIRLYNDRQGTVPLLKVI